jgi:hypothetical protein
MPAPVSPDAERLMELLPCPFCGSDNIAVRYVRDGRQAHCQYCWASSSPEYHGRADQPSSEERAIAAWNKRATQPDAGAMAEADNIARNMAIDLVACHIAFAGTSRDDVAALTVTKDMTRQIADALNAHAARREAAGFARGCEEAAKATESWFAEWSPKDAMNGRMCSAAIRTLASAGRALLGENAND